MKSKAEIAAEIEKLRKLKPVGHMAAQTASLIKLTIEVLQDGFDVTAEEFNELPASHQSAVLDTLAWVNTDTVALKPSEDWGMLVE